MSNDLTYMFLIMWAGDSDLCAKSKYGFLYLCILGCLSGAKVTW